MDGISSNSSPYAGLTNSVTSTKRTPTAYEVNSAEFGPTAAKAIDAAAIATDATTSAVSFSAQGLQRLASDAGDVLKSAFTGAEDGIASLGHGIANEAKKAYGAVAGAVNTAVADVQDAAKSTEAMGETVASAIGDAASYVKDEFNSVADTASKYLASGLSALA